MMKKMSKWSICLTLFAAVITGSVNAVAGRPAWSCWSNSQGVPEDFIPDMDYCSIYYVCDHEYRPVEKQCPYGLHADIMFEICEWPAFAITYPDCEDVDPNDPWGE